MSAPCSLRICIALAIAVMYGLALHVSGALLSGDLRQLLIASIVLRLSVYIVIGTVIGTARRHLCIADTSAR